MPSKTKKAARERRRERRRIRKATEKNRIKRQLRQARLVLLAYDPPATKRVPAHQELATEIKQLTTIPWNCPERIEKLPILPRLAVLRPAVGQYVPDPHASVRALRGFLQGVALDLMKRDARVADGQAEALVADREIGRPAVVLLGLRVATENAGIGVRRELAANLRSVTVATMRRWHEPEIHRIVALEIQRREVQFWRSLPHFAPNGKELPVLNRQALKELEELFRR